jgi:hypothetical protein
VSCCITIHAEGDDSCNLNVSSAHAHTAHSIYKQTYIYLGIHVQVVLHEERTPAEADGTVLVEQVVFEMTFSTMEWRRLRRRRTIKATA